VEALTNLVSAADVLLSPLRTRSSVPVKVTAAKPEPSAAASPAAS
jgi:hypothetical protein